MNTHISLSLFVESVWRDLRVACRNLMTHPGFTAMVVLSLGLGVGANTAVFSFIDGILLRPLAVPQGGDLVTFDTAASRVTAFGDTSYPDYIDVFKQSQDLLGVVAFRRVTVGLNPDASSSQARPARHLGRVGLKRPARHRSPSSVSTCGSERSPVIRRWWVARSS
jgi:hypothetical protein